MGLHRASPYPHPQSTTRVLKKQLPFPNKYFSIQKKELNLHHLLFKTLTNKEDECLIILHPCLAKRALFKFPTS